MAKDAGSREHGPELNARLRELPSVDELAGRLDGVPHALAVAAARAVIGSRRAALEAGGSVSGSLEDEARSWLVAAEAPSLRGVINATGVIVHTNLGRAPLADAAGFAVEQAVHGYSNLEYDLERGQRGSRQKHVEPLLCELTGAEAALVVNNCAAAVLLRRLRWRPAASSWSRADSSWRSAARSGCRTWWRSRERGSWRWAPPTARAFPTTSTRLARTPAP